MRNLADELCTMKLEGILLYGPRMKWLYDELPKTVGMKTRLVMVGKGLYADCGHTHGNLQAKIRLSY